MTIEKALKKLVRSYVYAMCFLTALVLFWGSSTQPFMMRVLVWLFFCLIVYRTLYNRYFTTESKKAESRKIWSGSYPSDVTFAHVVQTAIVFFLLWILTYTNLKAFTPSINPYASLIGFINGLTYGFLFFVSVFVE